MTGKKYLWDKRDKLLTVNELITCPHCGKSVGLVIRRKIEEVPIYRGDCVDCIHLKEFPDTLRIEDKKEFLRYGSFKRLN